MASNLHARNRWVYSQGSAGSMAVGMAAGTGQSHLPASRFSKAMVAGCLAGLLCLSANPANAQEADESGADASAGKEIVALLNKQINAALALPELKEKFSSVGLDMIGGTPEDFANIMRTEGERWAKVIKAANVKAK